MLIVKGTTPLPEACFPAVKACADLSVWPHRVGVQGTMRG